MYGKLFNRLDLNEVRQYVRELELVVESHTKWLTRLNRSIICHLHPDSSDISKNPHQRCHFGRWYHGVTDPQLTSLEAFQQVGTIHRELHLLAKRLLLKGLRGERIFPDEYDALMTCSVELRSQVYILRDELDANRDLSVRLMAKIYENANEGVVITAPDTTIISVNSAFSQVTGYPEDEVVGQKANLLKSGWQDAQFYRDMWQTLNAQGVWQGEIWNRKKDGEIYLERLAISAVSDEEGNTTHYVGIFSDITAEKEIEKQLNFLAHYDQLTALPNRILFADRFHQAVALARRERNQVAILFLDLDGFKEVNDSLGHAMGDELLGQVARRLTECLRATDTVARFGGDEFTVILPEIEDEESLIRIGNKIIAEIARPFRLDGSAASITASVGIALYPDDGLDPNRLLEHADTAMYQAKRHGKNHFEFYRDIRE